VAQLVDRLFAETVEAELRVLALLDEVLGDLVEAPVNRRCQRVELALDAIDPLRQLFSAGHFRHAKPTIVMPTPEARVVPC
jgi:hypothetical protein